MAKRRHDGGPAYPVAYIEGAASFDLGMSLRDWFAGRAVAGLCADPSNHELYEDHHEAAAAAYQIADAMLAARG